MPRRRHGQDTGRVARWDGATDRDDRHGRAGPRPVGGADAMAAPAGGARPGEGAAGSRARLAVGGTAWPMSRCCGPSPACSDRWRRTRRCRARSTASPRTRPRRWPRSTPPARRPVPGRGRWPVTTPPTTAPAARWSSTWTPPWSPRTPRRKARRRRSTQSLIVIHRLLGKAQWPMVGRRLGPGDSRSSRLILDSAD
jgi:hypothetical protein